MSQTIYKEKKDEELVRLKVYFEKWPELCRLYEYSRHCGYGFEIQPADEALKDLGRRISVWTATYSLERSGGESKDKSAHFKIIIPLDVLQINEFQEREKIIFAGEILEELAGLSADNAEFLERLRIQSEKLANISEEEQENIYKINLFSLSHEIGHLKIAENGEGGSRFYSRCGLYPSMGSQLVCFLDELCATLRGLEVLDELGLGEVLDPEFILEKGKLNSFKQCASCQAEIEGGRCPAIEEIDETLKRFP